MKLKTLKSTLQTIPPRLQAKGPGWRTSGMTTGERGYDYRWQKARKQHLFANPLCAMCYAEGIVKLATVVDHTIPHRGDMVLFWDRSRWQSLCTNHHNSHKQALERSGTVKQTIGADGWPTGAP